MKKEIFLSHCGFRVPGINSHNEIKKAVSKGALLSEMSVTTLSNGQEVIFGDIDLEEEEQLLPSRQDAKAMRKDVLAITICALEILQKMGLTDGGETEIPSYISSGAFIEGIFNKNDIVSRHFHKAVAIEDDLKRREAMYRIVPPLMALVTLTNAASSYVAQYTQIAGHNATYGNSSISGSYALHSAWKELESGATRALSGSSNRGNSYSYLTFRNLFRKTELWKESTGATVFLLSAENKQQVSDAQMICRLSDLVFSKNVPSVEGKADFRCLEIPEKYLEDSCIIFSGAYTVENYSEQLKLFRQYSDDCFSWFPALGSTGTLNMHLNILAAVEKLKHSTYHTACCIDKDPYGRESMVIVKGI